MTATTQEAPPRVLIVEDNPDYAVLTAEMLRDRWGARAPIEDVGTITDAVARIADGDVDCILLDLTLPDSDGLAGLGRLRAQAPTIPIVVLSGIDDEAVAVEAVRDGADDYLLKGRVDTELLTRSIKYSIERKRVQEELERLALLDGLTNLANRTLLADRLARAVARAERDPQAIAVFVCDLDDFKLINDSLGHDAGDLVLREVAERLLEAMRPSDSVARIGGDEFVIVCEGIDEREAVDVAARITDAMSTAIDVAGEPLYVTASIGIAVAVAGSALTPEELIRNADAAMYSIKQRGGAAHAFHDEGARERSSARLRLQSDLRCAVERDELRVYYQPIVDLASGNAVALEALLRWEHPTHGLLEPARFIPLAEDTGLIVPIGRWVLRESCRQLAAWIAANPANEGPTISVNVSARQLADDELPSHVEAALVDHGLEPRQLCLELTETSVMHDPAAALGALQALKALGVTIALDDFGTGYSSLSHLGRFPIDLLKIDRSFMVEDPYAKRIVLGVMGLAHSLGLTAIAEGVEVIEQVEDLKALGCEQAQGYYFARPEPADRAQDRLNRQR